jgi:predicted ATP-grasp superfamily ATP-dependent carboligase
VASLVARRTRQYPIEFGYTSTYVECVDQPRVEESARRILQAIGLSGLVEVEFKFDVRDGTYKILDINPRAWAWIGLGAAAGVDFPWIALRLAHGETIAPSQPRVGMAWMHASRDLVAACQEIWAGKRSLWSYFDVFRRSLAFAAFAKDDPWLSFVELPLVGLRVLQRKARMRWKRFAAGKSPLSPDNPRLPGECR